MPRCATDESHIETCERCTNCQGQDWIFDQESYQSVCRSCGLCTDGVIFIPAAPAGDIDGDHGGSRRFKGTYIRLSHISERLTAAQCQEPLVDEADMAVIEDEYERMQARAVAKPRPGAAARPHKEPRPLSRQTIQHLLRTLDQKQRAGKLPDRPSIDHSRVKRYWTVRYLERWKSISNRLSGAELPTFTQRQLLEIGSDLLELSTKWDQHQNPRDPKRDSWTFPDRKHFIAINYLIRMIMKNRGIKGFEQQFPLPRCQSTLKRLRAYYDFLATNKRQARITDLWRHDSAVLCSKVL